MYYLLIEARPVNPREEDAGAKGAYVSCWIDFKAKGGAVVLAEHAIRENGWEPILVDSAVLVDRADYEQDPENLALFDEAERDGESYVFHLWDEDDTAPLH